MRFAKQKQNILTYMLEGNTINLNVAWDMFGISKLSTRISELRDDGWVIEKGWKAFVDKDGHPGQIRTYWIKEENRQ